MGIKNDLRERLPTFEVAPQCVECPYLQIVAGGIALFDLAKDEDYKASSRFAEMSVSSEKETVKESCEDTALFFGKMHLEAYGVINSLEEAAKAVADSSVDCPGPTKTKLNAMTHGRLGERKCWSPLINGKSDKELLKGIK